VTAARPGRSAFCSARRAMARKLRPALGAALAIPLLAVRIAGAQPRGEGPLILRLPSSARMLAVGNAGLVSTDGDALFYNPGMLAQSRGSAASLQRYGSHGTAGSMATATTSGSMTIGVGAQFVTYSAPVGADYADIMKPGATRLSDSGGVAATSTAFTLGFAKTIKGWRLGANAKYVEDRIGLLHDGTVAFDVGLNRPFGPGTVGVVVQNLGAGPRIGGVEGTLPRRIGIGFGAARPIAAHWDLGAQTAVTLEGDLFVRPAGGGELSYVPIDGVAITLRQGFRLPRERDESLITAGLGVSIDRIAVDYAMEPMRGGRPVSHRIGVRVR
jgi:hypothetical protein